MVRSQIDNLTPDLSFGHNLCFNYPNGWYKPILDLTFQNISHDIRNSTIQWVLTYEIVLWTFRSSSRVQLPKWELTSECGSSFPHTLPHSHTPGSMKCDSQASLLARTFASPCLSREPKVRVATIVTSLLNYFMLWLTT